jgi:uncharacterized Zn-binding protein involved in type VI secretion
MPPATRVGDAHVCPVHTGGPVNAPGSTTVNIGGQPAARAGDRATCAGPDDTIVQGSPTVFIEGRPAARVGDKCAHTGMIVTGCPTVNIGNEGGGGGGSAPPVENKPDEEENTGGSGPIGGRTPPDEPPGSDNRRRTPSPGEQAVPRAGEQAIPRDPATPPPPKSAKPADKPKPTEPAGTANSSAPASIPKTKLDSPTLFGTSVTMETVQSLLGLARQMYPQLDEPLSRFDPQSLQATSDRLKDAIARKDISAVNQIGTQLATLIQNGGRLPPEDSTGSADSILRPVPERRDNYR